METSTTHGRVKRPDLKSAGVLKLCDRFASKLTRESSARGDNKFWFAIVNDHGYSQVVPVEFGR